VIARDRVIGGTERTIAKIAGIAKESKLEKQRRIAVIARDRRHRAGSENRLAANGREHTRIRETSAM
jgi:hypothetical protein